MKSGSTRGRVVRLGVAVALLAGIGVAGVSSSASADIIPADGCAHKVPTGSVPAVPGVYAPSDTCVNRMERTLVFVGESVLDTGVNFAGTGNNAPGGTYGFDGICVMVDWQAGTGTSVPSAGAPTPCTFNTTNGEFHNPDAAGNFVGQTLEGKEGNNINGSIPKTPDANAASGLGWDPDSQASCINSSGSGSSSFTSKGAFGSETWTSAYHWNNSLNNFVGTITDGTTSGAFNAKIRTDAYPLADKASLIGGAFQYSIDADRTDAGCLDKTLHKLNGAYDNVSPSLIGLRALLVSGTATWDIKAPGVN